MRLFKICALVCIAISLSCAAANDSVILVGSAGDQSIWLVGGYDPRKKQWLDDTTAHSFAKPGSEFFAYHLNRKPVRSVVEKIEEDDVVGGWNMTANGRLPENETAVAVSAPIRTVRRVAEQSLNQPTYRAAVAQLLKQKGLRGITRARLTQNLRIDLNNDGTDEVILCAHSRDDIGSTTYVKAGDYSIAALRFIRSDKAKTVTIAHTVYPTSKMFDAPLQFQCIAVVDINNDGRLEIILHNRYYEGDGLDVFTFDGMKVKKVLSAEWGV